MSNFQSREPDEGYRAGLQAGLAHILALHIGFSMQGPSDAGTECSVYPGLDCNMQQALAQCMACQAGPGHAVYMAGKASLGHVLHVVPTLDRPCILDLAHGARFWAQCEPAPSLLSRAGLT